MEDKENQEKMEEMKMEKETEMEAGVTRRPMKVILATKTKWTIHV
jgi:hypothetical protein